MEMMMLIETKRSSSSDGAMAETPRGNALTGDVIMARLGVYDLVSTKELILRDEELTHVDESCAQALASLEILSLSHNRLTSLEHFEHFTNLIELNLNFNQITSLANLQCAGLEKLFVANNRVSDIASLRTFQKLNTLSLYGNELTDLDATLHTCRAFPKLRSLDLGGNPCSRASEGYKFQVVRVLPRLKTLDGDQVTQLDKDLSEDFAVHGRSGQSKRQQPASAARSELRPFTAPVSGATDRLRPMRWDAPTPKAFDPFASKDMPKGNVRLFRDDFFNNHPILLEYLVEDAQDASPLDGTSVVSQARAKFHDRSSSDNDDDDDRRASASTGGFVDKMRHANPLRSADGSVQDDASSTTDAANASVRPTTASCASSVQTSHFSIDPSDPKTTIRKLLKHIEILMETIASQKNRAMDACSAALLEETARLQIENNNIPILQEQVAELKKQLAVAGASRSSVTEMERVRELELENAALKRENARLKHAMVTKRSSPTESMLSDSVTSRREGRSSSADVDAHDVAGVGPKRLASSELLDESAAIDVELTELILQNEVSLELIRNEIKNTKREWEVQLQHAKASARARPSTSLGVSSMSQVAASGSPAAVASSAGGASARVLHTSAGVRTSGPEEHLLRPSVAVHPLTTTRSGADILTL